MLASALDVFLKYYEQGGYVMPYLLGATVALWFGVGFRMSVLLPSTGLSPRQLLSDEGAAKRETSSSPVGRAARTGLEIMARRPADPLRALDDGLGGIRRELDAFRTLTSAVVAVAPLMGLLGTVSGMIETFASLGDMTLFSQSGGIAGGISQALLTTQFGLAIAIPGLIVRGLLERRQHLLETQIDEVRDILCYRAGQEVS